MIKGNFEITKLVHANPQYNIYGAIPIGDACNQVQLNKYGNITIKTNGFELVERHNYDLTLKEEQSKWGMNYIVVSTGLEFASADDITPELNYQLLCEIMTRGQASAIQDAYPNFIQLILNNRVDEIDVKNIYGVGEKLFDKYQRKIKARCTSFILRGACSDLDIDEYDAHILLRYYDDDVEKIIEALNTDPYTPLIKWCDHSFYSLDRNIGMKFRHEQCRIEWMMDAFIKGHEYEGSTYVDAIELAKEITNYDSEVVRQLKDVAVASDIIHYDEGLNILQRMVTYHNEKQIAGFMIDRLNVEQDIDYGSWEWQNFTEIKDGTLTEEQQNVLKMFCENNVLILNAPAGCVDCETEFFNGKGWKKISDYQEGDKVLQYNKDGSTTLVEPWRYIKEPCDTMYHFETKYGLDQTLTADHTVVYKTNRGHINTIKLEDMITRHNTNKGGFDGEFITSFSYNNRGLELTDDEIRLMCAIICDGSFYKKAKPHNDSYHRCRFHIKKERKKERLRYLFTQTNISWREKESAADGYTDLYIDAPVRTKEFTFEWYRCSQHQLEIICNEIMFWDGSTNYTPIGQIKREQFSTTVKANADFIQFAFSACGYRATIKTYDRRGEKRYVNGKEYVRKSIDYTVVVTKQNLCTITNHNGKPHVPITKVVPRDGYKYCFTVPSHMLVLRRNDKIFITGNCGKTATTKALLQMLEHYDASYICLAPTGKASARMMEQTGRSAYTIHRATLNGELNQNVVIIDETSMLSIELTLMVLYAITNDQTKILFIGDSAQIPSIGLGKVLKDMLASNIVPSCTLTKCFRFDEGGASYVSTLTRQGEEYFDDSPTEYTTMGTKKDYTYIPWNDDVDLIINTYLNEINNGAIPQDICLLVPYNKGSYGTVALNNIIQGHINPINDNDLKMTTKIENQQVTFHKGDMVMITKNDYMAYKWKSLDDLIFDGDPYIDEEDIERTSIFNGQVGTIIHMEPYNKVLNSPIAIIDVEGEQVVFSKENINTLRLAYACTIHKYQGSQAKTVIDVVIPQHSYMWNRQLLYTAQTRMQNKLIEIGDWGTIKKAIENIGDEHRNTRLKDMLISKTIGHLAMETLKVKPQFPKLFED